MSAGPEVLSAQETMERAINCAQKEQELVDLIGRYKVLGFLGGDAIGSDIFVVKKELQWALVALHPEIDMGMKDWKFLHTLGQDRNDFYGMQVATKNRLDVRIHMDSGTAPQIEALVKKDPEIKKKLLTAYFFDSAGSSLKVCSLPDGIRDDRTDLGQKKYSSKFVKVVMHEYDFDLVNVILLCFYENLEKRVNAQSITRYKSRSISKAKIPNFEGDSPEPI